jgi:hypothetical protein
MVNEHGDGTSAGQKAPDLLTVSQAAIVMQLGRTTAYALVSRFVETDGAEGIPAVVIGGQYRVPRTRLEQVTGGPISWPPRREPRRRSRAAEGRRGAESCRPGGHADGCESDADDAVEATRHDQGTHIGRAAEATDDTETSHDPEPGSIDGREADSSTTTEKSADFEQPWSQLSFPFEG